jgi:hypothetical protein
MTDAYLEYREYLQGGYIWRRKDTGRLSTVLHVANTELRGIAAQEHPPLVVYLDDKGKINAILLESYVEAREYDGVNTQLANALRIALGEHLEPYVNALTQEEIQETVEPELDPTPEYKSELSAEFFVRSLTDEYPLEPLSLNVEELAASILQYEQDPYVDPEKPQNAKIRHKVVVALNHFTMEALDKAFNISGGLYIDSFKINDYYVDWEEYHGTFPVISPEGVFASVVFTTSLLSEKKKPVGSTIVEALEKVAENILEKRIEPTIGFTPEIPQEPALKIIDDEDDLTVEAVKPKPPITLEQMEIEADEDALFGGTVEAGQRIQPNIQP